LSPPQIILNPNLASMRRLEIVGDSLEGLIDAPYRKRAWPFMSLINYAGREINCKIVYYGTGLGGKTTNLEYVYSKVNPDAKGKMISLATEIERTLFFDFLPIDLGDVKGFKTRFHLYTVPGQVYYNVSRKLILKGVDGVIFLADSQAERMEANIEAMHNLYENLDSYGYDLTTLPFAMQYNKRALPNAMPADDLRAQLNPMGVPDFEGVAIEGRGVFETLGAFSKMVVQALN
jgi:signal recognition particle receptor subunit beta